MEYLDLAPVRKAQGTLRLPGSKSISNRTLLLAALAQGETVIHDLLSSDDVERMLEALKLLGVTWHRDEHIYRVNGVNGPFPNKRADLFLGNAGTAFRPLTAALALCGGRYRLSGVPRMHERPIGDLVDALRQVGAVIAYVQNDGFPPLEISPASAVENNVVRVRGDVSSQFLTGLLMALPLTGRHMMIEVIGELISKPYVEITLNLMARFGVQVIRDGWRSFTLPAQSAYRSPGTIHVEGDASSASYFLAAGAIAQGPVRVEGVGRASIQGDVRFVEALRQLGARVAMGENWIEVAAPEVGKLRAFDMDLNHIPDAAMTIAAAALFATILAWAVLTQAFWPSSMALLAGLAPPEQRKAVFALHRLVSNLGMAVGPAMGGFIAMYGFSWVFWTDGLTTLASAALLTLYFLGEESVTAAPAEAGRAGSAWRDRKLLYLLLAFLPALMVFCQMTGVLPLWVVRDLGFTPRFFGLIFTLNTLLIVVLEVALNLAMARWPHQRQFTLGALLFAAGFGLTGLARTQGALLATAVIWTFGEMIMLPAMADAVATLAPAHRRGEFMGLYSLTFAVGMALGPWLGVLGYARGGPRLVWAACAVVGTGSAFLLSRFRLPRTSPQP